MPPRTPVLLTIAGSDSGGGAGLQADLAAFRDHGWIGATVVTSVTAQHTRGVTRVDPVPVDGVVAQLAAVFDDLDVAAVKIGMLGTAAHVDAVAAFLADLPARPPVVLDPVMVSTSGHRLLDADAVAALRDALAPLAAVLTPNLPEAELLVEAGEAPLLDRIARAWGERAVLVTGGDAAGEEVVDVLLTGARRRVWRAPRIAGGPFHGTGCTLSSALAARLGTGERLEEAVGGAIAYVRARLADAVAIGGGSRVGGVRPTWVGALGR